MYIFEIPQIEIDQMPIQFKYDPYPQQIKFMTLLLKSLKQQQIIALEAVTGFGKSLCLISTVMAFIQQCKIIKEALQTNKTLNQQQKYFYDTTIYFKEQQYQQINYPHIIFTSKTHSQLNQFKNVLQELNYQNITLASRRMYCINEEAKNLNGDQIGINTICNIMRKQNSCQYYNQKLIEQNTDLFMAKSQMQCDYSMKFFIDFCRQNQVCPYYLSKQISQKCDITLSPYQYVLQAAHCVNTDIEDSAQNEQFYKNNILVFDEAHNLPQAACDAFNVNTTYQKLFECLQDIDYLIQLQKQQKQQQSLFSSNITIDLEKDIAPLTTIINLRDCTQSILSQLKTTILENKVKFYNEEDYIEFSIPKQFPKINQRLIDVCNDMEQFINSSQFRQQKRHQCYLQYLSQIFTVVHLVQTQQEYTSHFKFVIQKTNQVDQSLVNHKPSPKLYKQVKQQLYEHQLSDNYQIQIVTLSPKYLMKKLITKNYKPSSIILTSGTLSPLQGIDDEFCLPFDVKQSLPSIFTKDSLKSFIITHNDEFKIDGSYNNRNDPQYINSVIKTIKESVKLLNYGGILVFFTSYSIMNKFYKQIAIDKQINSMSQIFIEYQDMNAFKDSLNRFQSTYKTKPTIFFAVYGGKLSEGIDFSNDMCRIVINVSLPFAPINSPYTQLKKQFIMQQPNGSSKYKLWYITQTFRNINQSCGRCIRHAKDFGMIILLDYRFQINENLNMLSKWISNCSESITLSQLDQIQWLKQKQTQYINQQQNCQNIQNTTIIKPKLLIKQKQTQNMQNKTQVCTLQSIQHNIEQNKVSAIPTQNTNNTDANDNTATNQYAYLQQLSQMDKIKKLTLLAKQFQLIATERIQHEFNAFVTQKRNQWKSEIQQAINQCLQDCNAFFIQNDFNSEQKLICQDMCLLKVFLMN